MTRTELRHWNPGRKRKINTSLPHPTANKNSWAMAWPVSGNRVRIKILYFVSLYERQILSVM